MANELTTHGRKLLEDAAGAVDACAVLSASIQAQVDDLVRAGRLEALQNIAVAVEEQKNDDLKVDGVTLLRRLSVQLAAMERGDRSSFAYVAQDIANLVPYTIQAMNADELAESATYRAWSYNADVRMWTRLQFECPDPHTTLRVRVLWQGSVVIEGAVASLVQRGAFLLDDIPRRISYQHLPRIESISGAFPPYLRVTIWTSDVPEEPNYMGQIPGRRGNGQPGWGPGGIR